MCSPKQLASTVRINIGRAVRYEAEGRACSPCIPAAPHRYIRVFLADWSMKRIILVGVVRLTHVYACVDGVTQVYADVVIG